MTSGNLNSKRTTQRYLVSTIVSDGLRNAPTTSKFTCNYAVIGIWIIFSDSLNNWLNATVFIESKITMAALFVDSIKQWLLSLSIWLRERPSFFENDRNPENEKRNRCTYNLLQNSVSNRSSMTRTLFFWMKMRRGVFSFAILCKILRDIVRRRRDSLSILNSKF